MAALSSRSAFYAAYGAAPLSTSVSCQVGTGFKYPGILFQIRPPPLPSTPFSIPYSQDLIPFDTIGLWVEILNVMLNKQ